MPEGDPRPVRHETTVPAAAADAFEMFTAGLARWWPAEFTWSQDKLEEIGIECREGGACYELGPDGFRCDWGRVVDWRPPERVLLRWQITSQRVPEPDPAKASEVVVTFTPRDRDGSLVAVEHRGFERHGDGADNYRAGMDRGWDYLLERFAHCVRLTAR